MTTKEFHLPAASTAPALARASVAATVGVDAQDHADDLLLLTSELVTNAVRHSGTAPFQDVIVRMEDDRDRVRIEVLSPGPSFDPPAPARPSPPTGTGLGLFLVDTLARRWGVEREGPRTKVWFEIDTTTSIDGS